MKAAAMRRLCAGLALPCLVGAPAWAHDLWLDKEAGAWVLYQGHRHSAHSGAELVPYEPVMVKGWLCVDEQGTARPLAGASAYPAKVVADCATLAVRFATGYWTKTAWDTRNLPKTGITGVLKSWYSEESLKLVQRWASGSTRPLGQGLELTPTSNPLLLKAGDKLVVLVTDGGKPVAGVPVAYAGDTRGASGDDGKVSIRLRQAGLQLLQASRETPRADGKADLAVHSASLQFEIAK